MRFMDVFCRLMKEKAASIGRRIREVRIRLGHLSWQVNLIVLQENGVHTAIFTIYTYLHRASQDRAMLDKH